MSKPKGANRRATADLAVHVQGDSITVTKLGTSFSATYEKRPDNAPRHYTRLARAGQDELNQEDWNLFCNVAVSLVDAIRAIEGRVA